MAPPCLVADEVAQADSKAEVSNNATVWVGFILFIFVVFYALLRCDLGK